MSKKISELPNATALSGTETIPLVQAGETRKTTVAALQTVADGAITTPKLQDNAVTAVKIADDNVTTAKLQNDSVTFAKTQNIATNSFLGRTSAGTGDIEVLTPAQAQTLLRNNPIQSMVRLNGANGYGSTSTRIRRFTTVLTNVGSDITYADSANLGASFTINTSGNYVITYTEDANAATNAGISLNTTQPSTDIVTITASTRLASTIVQAFLTGHCSWSGYLTAGDVIRPHCSGTAASTNDRVFFTIARVS